VTADLPTAATANVSVAATTSIGAVSLTVSDLERARAFYE
jgi:catechol-2,3-dioxygenase